MNDSPTGRSAVSEVTPLMERILYEVKRVVVGQDHFLERVMVAMLAQGHLLVEGVPGLAKTLTVKTLARTIQGTFKRIQFTPDLVPADLVGTRIYNQKTGEFNTSLGPVFTHLLLADEINRAPAKVQSALLEVMQEYQVTIAGQTHRVPEPFLVMATQNPIETEGTYPLPEAQVDRFMMKILVGYPSEDEEFVIVERVTGRGTGRRGRGHHRRTRRAATRMPDRLRGPFADALRCAPDARDAQPRTLRHSRHGAVHHLWRQSARIHPSYRGGARAGVPARARLRAARGRQRPGARRAAPPAVPVLRSAGRRGDRRRVDPAHPEARPATRKAARRPCPRHANRRNDA